MSSRKYECVCDRCRLSAEESGAIYEQIHGLTPKRVIYCGNCREKIDTHSEYERTLTWSNFRVISS